MQSLVLLVDDPEFQQFADARILHLRRYSQRGGLRHEWLVLQVQITPEQTVWLRLERTSQLEWKQVSNLMLSRLPVHDVVRRF